KLGDRVADERPALEARVALHGDADGLDGEARQTDEQEGAEDGGVLGPGLDADAVRPLDVAPADGPQDADDEEHAHGVAEGRVPLVDVAVQELPRSWHLVLDLEDGGD